MPDRTLLGWVEDPPADRGIRFGGPGESWDFWSYERLARLARQVAAGLADAGVARGDPVSFVQRSGPGFVGTLFGTMLAGAVPSPVAPPMVFQDLPRYRRHLAGLLAATRPALVVTDADLTGEVAELAAGSRVVPAGEVLGDAERAPPRAQSPAELALLQFTSGSSGRARGVKVPFAALQANVAAIRQWLGMDGRRATASWLPLHHDMGLIGCLVTPVVDGSDVWLLAPEDFVQRPLRYLRCFAARPAGAGAELTAMPSFGLQYVARRVHPDALAGLDFSGWRAVIVGAERVSAVALDRFHALLGPFGLPRRALLPAYGLAEATLAVTGLPVDEEWSARTVAPETLALGAEVALAEPVAAGAGPTEGTPGAADDPPGAAAAGPGQAAPVPPLVGCGRPLAGVSVTVAGEDGAALPDGRVGEILVRGPAVMAGYLAAEESRSLTSLVGGTLSTGDAGFVADGQLYVLGRLGDSMKVRARAVFAEDLEAVLAAAGMAGHRVAVALGDRAGAPIAVAVLERPEPDWAEEARTLLRRGAEGAEVVVVCAGAGSIPRTSSGKPKRRELWRALLDGRLSPAGDASRTAGPAGDG